MPLVYILWTCRNPEEARRIVHSLLEQRLIACASLFPVQSIYRWEGALEESQEVKVILKTTPSHFKAIQSHIQAHSSYQVPEITQLDATQAHPPYAAWVAQETDLTSN